MPDIPPPSPKSFTKEAISRIQRSEGQEQETKVPLTDEKLEVSKENRQSQATITKEPVKETKKVDVPLTHEEITIETRLSSGDTQAQKPVSSKKEYNNTD